MNQPSRNASKLPLAVLAILGLVGLGLALYWDHANRSAPAPVPAASSHASLAATHEPLLPLPSPPPLDPRKVELGRLIFADPRMSHDDTLSCASCHNLQNGGVDSQPRSRGIGGQLGNINAPTVFNSSLNFRQFWDGRARTLEDQAAGPVHNPVEMGSSWPEVVAKLKADPDYRARFDEIYGGVEPAAIQNAIATFERSLLTPSRFDRYLRGDHDALTADEIAGYELFKRYGCTACHQGANIGGNMFQKFGVMGDYFADHGGSGKADLGRFNVTGIEEDRNVFKVPSLRNVGRTAPYFHNGSVSSLEEAVKIMGRYQLGVELPEADAKHIVAFLRSLDGDPL